MFQLLGSCRALGPAGVGSIPWTALNDYAYRHDIWGDDFLRLEHFITVLDGVYLSSTGKPDTPSNKRRGLFNRGV